MRRLRIGMAQINTTVGDFAGNTQKILDAVTEARSLGVDLLAFSELVICGYPPEDLLFKPQFIDENLRCLDKVVDGSSGLTIVVGFVDALGHSNVVGVTMPSGYSSPASISDAELLAQNLGIKLLTIPIEKAFQSYLDMLAEVFEGTSSKSSLVARLQISSKR